MGVRPTGIFVVIILLSVAAIRISYAVVMIYDKDDRMGYGDPMVTSNEDRAADTTAILVRPRYFEKSADGKSFDLPGGNVIDPTTGTGLCASERFSDEPNPGFCSGFRVAETKIATAGHCIVTQADCRNTWFVFGFYKKPGNKYPEKAIPRDNVYRCVRTIDGIQNSKGPDWRVVEVDRKISFGTDVILRTVTMKPELRLGDKLVVIGYPLGLPVKITDKAVVHKILHGFFVANSDTFYGNSGSAVFDEAALNEGRLLVDGILARGAPDFSSTDPCFKSRVCPKTPVEGTLCKGEDATFASEIVSAVLRPE